MRTFLLPCALGAIVISTASPCAAGPLELRINLADQTFDWLDGTSITQVTSLDDNRFGSMIDSDVIISSPLAAYTGAGAHYSVIFDLSAGGTSIDGVGLCTSDPPGLGAVFSGDAAGPAIATYDAGSFAALSSLSVGSFLFAPVGPWDDGVLVHVIPSPGALAVCIASLGAASPRVRRRR